MHQYKRPATLSKVNWDSLSPEDRDALRALVPPKDVVEQYVSRTLDGGFLDLDALGIAMDNKLNVMLWGPTQSAKTTVLRAFAAQWGLPMISIPINGGIDVEGIPGGWRPHEEKLAKWYDSMASLIVANFGVIEIGEPNMTVSNSLARLFELLDNRRQLTREQYDGSVIKAGPAVLLGGTLNLGKEYAGTFPLNEAFKERFPVRIEWGYSEAVEDELIGVHALQAFARSVRGNKDIKTPFSTKLMEDYILFSLVYNAEFAAAQMIGRFSEHEQNGVALAFAQFRDQVESEVAELLAGEDALI